MVLLEGNEKFVNFLLRHARPRIAYRHCEIAVFFRFRMEAGGECDSAGFRELESIAQNIHQHLSQAFSVELELPWQSFRKIESELQIFAFRQRKEYFGDVVQKLLHVQEFRSEIHLVGFQFGKIQHVVDELQQCASRLLNRIQSLFLLGFAHMAALQQFAESYDRIQRGAQFMAHRCKEIALGTVRRLRGSHGDFKLTFALIDLREVDRAFQYMRNGAFSVADRRCGNEAVVAVGPDLMGILAAVFQHMPHRADIRNGIKTAETFVTRFLQHFRLCGIAECRCRRITAQEFPFPVEKTDRNRKRVEYDPVLAVERIQRLPLKLMFFGESDQPCRGPQDTLIQLRNFTAFSDEPDAEESVEFPVNPDRRAHQGFAARLLQYLRIL